jgi:hypothetical protein
MKELGCGVKSCVSRLFLCIHYTASSYLSSCFPNVRPAAKHRHDTGLKQILAIVENSCGSTEDLEAANAVVVWHERLTASMEEGESYATLL